MKKTILLATIGLLLISGCSMEKDDTQTEKQNRDLVYVFNSNGENLVLEESSLDKILSNKSNTKVHTNRGNSAHTHGDYNDGSISLSWSGTENNGGMHGSAIFELLIEDPFGFVSLTMETECVMVEGNEAIYGGTFTKVLNPAGPFMVGNIMYFKVIDNGQGNNASPDQHAIGGLIVPPGGSVCNVLSVTDPFWERFGLLDVAKPGSVKVN